MSETPFNSAEYPFKELMTNSNKNNFFISVKWILFICIIFNYSHSFAYDIENLKRVEISQYISSYQEYNEEVINTKEHPEKKSTKNHTVGTNVITKISNILIKEMKLAKAKSERLSSIIAFAAKKYSIDPRIMIAIMKIESNFKQNAVNLESCKRTKQIKCGDYSIAQINYEVWSKSFPKMGRKPLDLQRLKTDESYAIFRMAEILNLLQTEFANKDKFWFARYHSATPKHKERYKVELKRELRKVIALGPNLMKDFPKVL